MKLRKSKKISLAILFLVLITSFYFGFIHKDDNKNFDTLTVQKTTLVQTVQVTGKVIPAQEAKIAFEQIGKITNIYVRSGDKMQTGQLLISQNNSVLASEYNKAKASLENSEAQQLQYEATVNYQNEKLNELKRGARPEDIEIKKAELNLAEENLNQYYNDISRILQNAYNISDDAVRIKTSSLFFGSPSSSYQLTYATCDQTSKAEAEQLRLVSERELNVWENQLVVYQSAGSGELISGLKKMQESLILFQKFLQKTSDTLSISCVSGDSSLDEYRINITQARSNINTVASGINTQLQNIASQKITVEKIRRELNLKLAGASSEEISAQEYLVKQAEANLLGQKALYRQAQAQVQNIAAQLSKTVIRAPFSGTITSVDAKIGEITGVNNTVISLISEENYEIKMYVAEVDIAKISVGKKAEVTLDAYGDEKTFLAEVYFVDPAETIIENVATYKVLLHFANIQESIKSGMTANVVVIAETKENVITVPQRAIIQKNGKEYVRVLSQENPKVFIEVGVVTGIRGSDGTKEIIEGITEGDRVVIF